MNAMLNIAQKKQLVILIFSFFSINTYAQNSIKVALDTAKSYHNLEIKKIRMTVTC